MIQLPSDFTTKMKAYLGADYDAFLSSYSEPRVQGLRLNLLKISPDSPAFLTMKSQFGLTRVPWCPSGYYYEDTARPGKHPYHAAGLYYIQEPSAMSAVELLNPKPGDIVLDLAAAPGGKSTHIAGMLGGKGLVIANEIHPSRAKILSENIERCGIRNAVVTNCAPDQLAHKFRHFFDKIMVDAPCSGEGMFRKDPDAIQEWSVEHVDMCAARQMDILEQAVVMLKPGGTLAYSTCTFSQEENEQTVEALVSRFTDLSVQRTERIWPHIHKGEGHFVAVLVKKRSEAEEDRSDKSDRGKRKPVPKQLKDAITLFEQFAEEYTSGFELDQGEPILFGEQLYLLPQVEGCLFDSGYLEGLKVLRPGLHVASVRKNRVEPAHALALALHSSQATQYVTLSPDSPETLQYLKGGTIRAAEKSGWLLVTVDGHPLGWGKASAGQIKNHYPKGLRWLG